ncbi:hypothetical protein PLANPX_4777 [Lacipirellula parvula]|uniref:DNA polymerase Y-family little finger domain-containing protein n=2 Tax=Lacipirellula parvula TaxID=2650471 RepID=A0A5K7XFJ4_9BACT|nr:hypothetical protein PLANPX_4777 [Lacipirellula parvula]
MKRQRLKQRALSLWLPDWPLQRVRLERPALKRCELSLYCQQHGALRLIASDRYAAGTPLAEVVRGKVEQHDPDADRETLLRLAAWCEQFSPIVGIEPPDCLHLDVTGLDLLYGSEEILVKKIAESFQRRGLGVRGAIADTVGIAWGVSHYASQPWSIVRSEALFRSLPIEALRVVDDVAVFSELGVTKINQLLAIPRTALASRFGSELIKRIRQAIGEIPEPIVSHRPPPKIQVETRCEYPVGDRCELQSILSGLIQRVAAELARRQQGALQVRCEFQSERGPLSFTASLFRPTSDSAHLLELVVMQLDRIAIVGPIDCVTMAVTSHAPLTTWQQELFEDSRREESRRVGLLVDRLSNRLGREAVVRSIPQQEAQPELAVRYEPLAGAVRSKSKRVFSKIVRPLHLEIQPRPIKALAVAPDGPPLQFHWHGDHVVRRACGPERIQTGWWRGRYVQRDYYRVETSVGKRFWLFRELRSGKWFLHGAYD